MLYFLDYQMLISITGVYLHQFKLYTGCSYDTNKLAVALIIVVIKLVESPIML